jgi:hypothetical protein
MKHLQDIVSESIFDDEDVIMDKSQRKIMLNVLEKARAKYEMSSSRSKKYPMDMFGREIKVGDICFAYISMEFHFIQVKEIINDGGWFDLVPTVNYKYIDGQGLVSPSCCILIPEKYYGEFLKIIK